MHTRRELLGAAALGLGATACGASAGGSDVTDDSTGKPSAGSASLAEAERWLDVEYSTAEREQMLPRLEEQLAWIRLRRAHPLPDGLAPASRFDPRLPGRDYAVEARMQRGKPAARPLPGDPAEIAFAPLTDLAEWIAARALGSVELTEIYLERLARLGPALECVVERTETRAREQARRADAELARGASRGPLHGIPFGAKDLLDTAGIRTGWGAEPYRDRIPERDAAVIERLERAGAVLVAKLSLGALAYGDLWSGGWTRSPWHPEDGASGSSAGSASATAAGLVAFAIGSETLGSIVSPSMRCGTVGLRPTFGRVARSGAMTLCWSLDKLGPMTRRVEDALLVLDAIHGADPGDPSSLSLPLDFDAARPIAGRRIGWLPREFEHARPPEREALDRLRVLGVELVPLDFPALPQQALLPILHAEAAASFESLTLANRDDELRWQADEAWPNSFRAARFISAIDLIQADRLRRELMQALDERFRDVEAIVAPSFGRMLLATNFTGHPSLTLRAGFVERGPIPAMGDRPAETPRFEAPLGITLWGRLYQEGRLCELGIALESALGVWQRRPAQ
jgi:Asp-tRNA(Asn)/Glu-tRNA(Gln) amidotransferase A subunit family amidase